MDRCLSDEEIVSRIRDGDPESYEIVVARHQKRLTSLARRILKNEADAEDAVQDAHLRAWQHIHQFRASASFASWIGSVTVNSALMEMRKRKRQARCETVECATHSMEFDPERWTAHARLSATLAGVVKELPESYRAVFRLRTEEELSTAETGARLGLTCDNVKTRLRRARRLIRERLR